MQATRGVTLGFLPSAVLSLEHRKSLTLHLLVIIPYLSCVSPQERMPQTPPFAAVFDSSGYNRNLYQSKEDNCGGLYYHENNLLSGSLEALIQHLVPNVDYYPDVSLYTRQIIWLGLMHLVKGNFRMCSKSRMCHMKLLRKGYKWLISNDRINMLHVSAACSNSLNLGSLILYYSCCDVRNPGDSFIK